MTSMRKRQLCKCGKNAKKAGLCMTCYNRRYYEAGNRRAPGHGAPVKVKGWGYA